MLFILNVIMLNVAYSECHSAECHYAECLILIDVHSGWLLSLNSESRQAKRRYAECRYAKRRGVSILFLFFCQRSSSRQIFAF
jgi:hypothetical protein